MKHPTLFLLIMLCSQWLFGQWTKMDGPETTAFHFLKQVGDEIWAGTNHALYRSVDNGQSWSADPNFGPALVPLDLAILNQDVYLLVNEEIGVYDTDSVFIYHSADLGVTWEEEFLPFYPDLLFDAKIALSGDWLFYGDFENFRRKDLISGNWETISAPGIVAPWNFESQGDTMLLSVYVNKKYISTDNGDNWTFLGNWESRTQLLDGTNLYLLNYDTLGVSNDLGQTWEYKQMPTNTGWDQKVYKDNSERLYNFGQGLYYSDDEGDNWVPLNLPFNYLIEDMLESDNILLLSTSNGIYRSTDAGLNWIKSNDGLLNGQFDRIHGDNENKIFALRNSMGGYASPNNGNSWVDFQFDYTGSRVTDVEILEDSLLLGIQNLGILLYANGLDDPHPVDLGLTDATRIKMSYKDGFLYLVTNDHIYRTNDFQNLETIQNPIIYYDTWEDIHVSQQHILVSSKVGKVFRYDLSGNNPEEIIEVDHISPLNIWHTDSSILIAEFGAWYISEDEGASFTPFQPSGIPEFPNGGYEPPSGLVAHEGIFYACFPIDGNIYVSLNNGLNWIPYMEGIPVNGVSSLTTTNDLLIASTTYNGLYSRGLSIEQFSGKVFRDDNQNGMYDNNEVPLPNIPVKCMHSGLVATSDLNGNYSLYSENLPDTLQAMPDIWQAAVNPAFYEVAQSAEDLNFGVFVPADVQNLVVELSASDVFRPGFENSVLARVSNHGGLTADAVLKITIPDNQTIDLIEPEADQVSGDTLIWFLNQIPSLESRNIWITMTTDPAALLGEIVNIPALVLPLATDDIPLNNEDQIVERIVSSFDPNDKSASPADIFPPEGLENGEEIEYTIRFQNTGNYPADFVRIIDTISTKLDLSSLRVLAASHDYELVIREEREVEFIFNAIFLPDSTSNEPESHGFIKYSIRPKPENTIGDTFENTAYIYFDFNPPIQTNTVGHIIKEPVDFPFADPGENRFDVFPNPNSGSFILRTNPEISGSGFLTIYDAAGKWISRHQIQLDAGVSEVNLGANTGSGVYTAVLQFQEQKLHCKIVVK
ncbi:MAG: T9SS type A sorting domain-containing protein [Bacteroidetes bacterium]|nr:T9SS type A sorting domain-containing protein [Bacteroidota bacterium]